MIETICRDCGQRYQVGTDHVCPKAPAKKSTAAGMDRPLEAMHDASPNSTTVGGKTSAEAAPKLRAGTQAPPVDKRGPGRPRTIADLKAYRLQKQRERRAKIKEAQERQS